MSLTPAQAKLMLHLQREIDATGICPSYEDMQRAMGLASKSGIHRLLCALAERGFVSMLPHRSRSVRIIDRVPDPLSAPSAREAYRSTLKQIATDDAIEHVPRQMARKVLERFP